MVRKSVVNIIFKKGIKNLINVNVVVLLKKLAIFRLSRLDAKHSPLFISWLKKRINFSIQNQYISTAIFFKRKNKI